MQPCPAPLSKTLLLVLSTVVILVVSKPAHAAQALCCTSAGGTCSAWTAACSPAGGNSATYAWVATVWADQARVDLSSGPDNFGIAVWWMNGPNVPNNIVNAQNVKLEATNRDASKPVQFCFNAHNTFLSPPITETVHVVYNSEFAQNYATPSGLDCVNATIDSRFVTPVPAVPSIGIFGLAGSLAIGGCFFGVRSWRRSTAS